MAISRFAFGILASCFLRLRRGSSFSSSRRLSTRTSTVRTSNRRDVILLCINQYINPDCFIAATCVNVPSDVRHVSDFVVSLLVWNDISNYCLVALHFARIHVLLDLVPNRNEISGQNAN